MSTAERYDAAVAECKRRITLLIGWDHWPHSELLALHRANLALLERHPPEGVVCGYTNTPWPCPDVAGLLAIYAPVPAEGEPT